MPPVVGSGDGSRLTGADAMRAAACLLVLLQHLSQRIDPRALPDFFRPIPAFLFAGTFGVAAFFVLSGYLLSRPFWVTLDQGARMPSIRTYALRRVARILPGYWLALTVTFVLSFTVFQVPLDRLLAVRYVGGLLFINEWHWKSVFPVEVNGPLWSIGFEVASYAFLRSAWRRCSC